MIKAGVMAANMAWKRDDRAQTAHGSAHADAREAEVLCAAEDMAEEGALEALAENQGIAERPPQQQAHRGEGDTLGGDGEDVLGADEAAVKQEEPRDAHQQN